MKIDRDKVWKKYDCKCAYCGEDLEYKAMQVDHIIPGSNYVSQVLNKVYVPKFLTHLTVNDLNHFDNLNPTCRQCNFYKSCDNIESFRTHLKDIHVRIMKPFISRLGAKYAIITINEWDGKFYFEQH